MECPCDLQRHLRAEEYLSVSIDISTFSGTMKLALESLNLPIMDEDMHLEYDQKKNILEYLVVKRNNLG
jgi:hypothetical protein